MALDRTKFAPVKVQELKNQQEAVNTSMKKPDIGLGMGFISLKVGVNKIRIYPRQSQQQASWTYANTVHWLPNEVWIDTKGSKWHEPDEEQIAKFKLKKEIKNTPVFNAKRHSSGKGAVADICDIYIDFAKAFVEETFLDAAIKTKKMATIIGKKGILPSTNWILYADLINESGFNEFGRLTLTNGTKEKLNMLAASEESDQVIETDPFTHPDSGKIVKINYDKGNPDGSKVYVVTFVIKDDMVQKLPISDEALEKFEENPSLETLYVNNYTHKDFTKAITCLSLFDQINEFGIFDNDEFWKKVQEMEKLYPKEEYLEVEEKVPETNVESKVEDITDVEEEEEEEEELSKGSPEMGDVFASMTREELKIYKVKNKLHVIFLKSDSDEDIRNKIRDVLLSPKEELEVVEEEEDPVIETTVKEKVVEKPKVKVKEEKQELKKEESSVSAVTASKLEEMRKRLAKK